MNKNLIRSVIVLKMLTYAAGIEAFGSSMDQNFKIEADPGESSAVSSTAPKSMGENPGNGIGENGNGSISTPQMLPKAGDVFGMDGDALRPLPELLIDNSNRPSEHVAEMRPMPSSPTSESAGSAWEVVCKDANGFYIISESQFERSRNLSSDAEDLTFAAPENNHDDGPIQSAVVGGPPVPKEPSKSDLIVAQINGVISEEGSGRSKAIIVENPLNQQDVMKIRDHVLGLSDRQTEGLFIDLRTSGLDETIMLDLDDERCKKFQNIFAIRNDIDFR